MAIFTIKEHNPAAINALYYGFKKQGYEMIGRMKISFSFRRFKIMYTINMQK